MIYVFYIIHVMVSLFLILVVLLQQGKGADLSVFGGGATQAAFGARGAATLLHKLTVGGFIAFIVTTMSIGLLQGTSGGGSVMSNVVMEESAAADDAAEAMADDTAEAVEAASDDVSTTLEEAADTAAEEVAEPAASEPETPQPE